MTSPDQPNLNLFPAHVHFIEQTPPPQTTSDYPTWQLPFSLPVLEADHTNCPYREGYNMNARGFACEEVPPDAHQLLMDAGFRRSGRVFYQPVCKNCRSCIPLRVPVARFKPSRSQKRTLKRNRDLTFDIGKPAPDEEKYLLYHNYLQQRHDGQQASDFNSFIEFLYDSPTDTLEFTYRDQNNTLIAVGLCDVTEDAISTMYFYFDPEQSKRSLGIYSALMEIEYARATNLDHYYLGYWIPQKDNMAYKARFQPAEILCTDSIWRPIDTLSDNVNIAH